MCGGGNGEGEDCLDVADFLDYWDDDCSWYENEILGGGDEYEDFEYEEDEYEYEDFGFEEDEYEDFDDSMCDDYANADG